MSEIAIYQTDHGAIEVKLEKESIWLTQRQMGELFNTSTDNIGLHLKRIFAESELDEMATTEESSVVQRVNALMTTTYREIGRRIVEFKQGGKNRTGDGEA